MTMELAMVFGIGLVCFLLIYLAFNLEKKHFLFQLILLFFAFSSLMLIPKGLIDIEDSCELKLNYTESYINGAGNNQTNYTYNKYCMENEHNTPIILHKLVMWVQRIFWMYVFGYFVYEILKWMGYIVPKDKK